jgi:hypothetical protein
MQASGKVKVPVSPKAHLSCGPGQKISSIKFASFGTPVGSCGNYREGSCHAHKSYDAFQEVSLLFVQYFVGWFLYYSEYGAIANKDLTHEKLSCCSKF